MPITIGDLEAAALDDDRAGALSLRARVGARERQPQYITAPTVARDGRTGGEQGARRSAVLVVALGIVVLLAPRLRRLIERGQGQVWHMLKHGHQAAFDRAPEGLGFSVLVRTISKCCLVQDAEACEPLCDLGGGHRCAVVAQRRARQAALPECPSPD